MKKLSLIAVIFCTLFVSSATAITLNVSIPHAKIDEFFARNPNLPDFDRASVMNGEFNIGIRTETLVFMFGEPRSKRTIRQPWATQEEWNYRINRDNLFFTIENGGVVGIEARRR